MHTYINFHGNPLDIKKVPKPDIRPDIRIITKNIRDLFWRRDIPFRPIAILMTPNQSPFLSFPGGSPALVSYGNYIERLFLNSDWSMALLMFVGARKWVLKNAITTQKKRCGKRHFFQGKLQFSNMLANLMYRLTIWEYIATKFLQFSYVCMQKYRLLQMKHRDDFGS